MLMSRFFSPSRDTRANQYGLHIGGRKEVREIFFFYYNNVKILVIKYTFVKLGRYNLSIVTRCQGRRFHTNKRLGRVTMMMIIILYYAIIIYYYVYVRHRTSSIRISRPIITFVFLMFVKSIERLSINHISMR